MVWWSFCDASITLTWCASTRKWFDKGRMLQSAMTYFAIWIKWLSNPDRWIGHLSNGTMLIRKNQADRVIVETFTPNPLPPRLHFLRDATGGEEGSSKRVCHHLPSRTDEWATFALIDWSKPCLSATLRANRRCAPERTEPLLELADNWAVCSDQELDGEKDIRWRWGGWEQGERSKDGIGFLSLFWLSQLLLLFPEALCVLSADCCNDRCWKAKFAHLMC